MSKDMKEAAKQYAEIENSRNREARMIKILKHK